MSNRSSNPLMHSCCDSLVYKYNGIMFNLLHQLNRMEEVTPIFRQICEYEVRERLSFDDQRCLWMCEQFVGVRRPTTLKQLAAISDARMLAGMRKLYSADKKLKGGLSPEKRERDERPKRAAKRTCAHCGKKEAMLGDYKACGGCKSVTYCDQDCQKGHWRTHKVACKAAAAKKAEKKSTKTAQF